MNDTNETPKERNGIVLNRMYVGTYLASNLGHEVINMYQADNGGHYLYLNATGDFVKEHAGRIRYMLLVKYSKAGVIEVLGMATDLEDVFDATLKKPDSYEENNNLSRSQLMYIINEGCISYGGVPIVKLFNDAEQQNVYITFKAAKLYVPQKSTRIFIHFADEEKSNDKITEPFNVDKKNISGENTQIVNLYLCAYKQAKASLKQYLYPEGSFSGNKDNIEGSKRDYELLINKLVLDNNLWEESNKKVDLNHSEHNISEKPVSLFDICQVQTNENIFSNALSYFMQLPEYKKLWVGFFKEVCGIDLRENYTVTREEYSKIEDKANGWKSKDSGGRIDLMIRDENTLFAIENKIESDINSISTDGAGGQLLRYWNYLNWKAEKEGGKKKKIIKAIILCPNYNIPNVPVVTVEKNKTIDLSEIWRICTYKDLYNYLKNHSDVFENNQNFKDFFNAMERHTFPNISEYLYYEMQSSFFRRIAENKAKNSEL